MREPLTRLFERPTLGKGGGVDYGKNVDLFVVTGQSNANGKGNSALAPAAPSGLEIVKTTFAIKALADPVGDAATGSMWPAWANGWYQSTGRRAVILELATDSTALLPDASGGWSPGGSLRAAVVTQVQAAIAALGASVYTLVNVHFIWCQGESDAGAINGTTITADLYEAGLQTLATYFAAQIPTMGKMFVVQLGVSPSGAGQPAAVAQTQLNYMAVRRAQARACDTSSILEMVYTGTFAYPYYGYTNNDIHWNQAGLNLAGKCGSLRAGGASPAVMAPSILAMTPRPDASTSTKTTRTISHTTAAGTKALVVVVSCGRSSSAPALTATFGGVSFPLPDRVSGAEGGTGRNLTSMFLLTEAMYGGSLDAVTQNLVVTASQLSFSLHVAIYDIDCQIVPMGLGTSFSSLATDTQSHSIFVAEAGLVISAVQAVSPADKTVAFTGATEDMDASVLVSSNYYQFATAHKAASALEDVTISTVHSGSCTYISAMSVVYRRPVGGEI